MEKNKLETKLADSDDAVVGLLESLLAEVDDIENEEPALKTETEVKTTAHLPLTDVDEAQPESRTQTQPDTDVEPGIEGDLPDWSRQRFSCLLFDVEGTEMAVPLHALNSIAVWDMETLPMPAQPDWHLGVVSHRDENIVLVDTARLIMPDSISGSVEERLKNHGSHFLVIDQRWGLSCNGIRETVELTPEQVRWRPKRPSRPWALGTLIDRLSVLLDAEALLQGIE